MAEKPRGVYVPLDVLITDDEDIAQVGMFGFALYVSGLAYSKRNRTDGFLSASILTRLLIAPTIEDVTQMSRSVDSIVAVGLWNPVDGGYEIRSWAEWNPVDGDREKWAERKRRSRNGHADVTVPGTVSTGSGHVTPSHADVTPESRPGHEMSRHEVEEKRREVKPSSEPSPDVESLCTLLADLVEANGAKRPTVSAKWRDEARRMLERDERDRAEAERVMRWALADSFWQSNVMSMPTFRAKYDQLKLRMGPVRNGRSLMWGTA